MTGPSAVVDGNRPAQLGNAPPRRAGPCRKCYRARGGYGSRRWGTRSPARFARHLEGLHCRTPRGETRWPVSSAQDLLAHAATEVTQAMIMEALAHGG